MSANTKRPTIFFDERPAALLVQKASTTASKAKGSRSKSQPHKQATAKAATAEGNGDKHTKSTEPPAINQSRALLLARWKKKQSSNGDIEDAEEVEDQSPSAGTSIKDIINEGEDIDTVKKTSVFSAELTEEEQDIIKKRVAQQQRQFEEYRRREVSKKYAKIRLVHRHVTEKEVSFALDECQDDEVKFPH